MNNVSNLFFSDTNDNFGKCLAFCTTISCQSNSKIESGCNQMYSCKHACKIRDLGENEEQCKKHCQRKGNSGCGPQVNGYQFALCRACGVGECNKSPTVDECENGCANYGKMYFLFISLVDKN